MHFNINIPGIIVTLPNAEAVAKGVALRAYTKRMGVSEGELAVKTEETNLPESAEWLGTPTLTALGLKGKENSIMLTEVLMTVSMEKNIVVTALQGRNGTIKEYISDGDYSIDVSAALSSEGDRRDEYPLKDLKTLRQLLSENVMLEVNSDFLLDIFGIKNIVVKGYSFGQETHSNRQSFTMSLLSDDAYEIKIEKDAGTKQ
jgi:hypothetical protein